MTKVKICGVRSPENALMVARAGADFIGLNFYPESPRYVELALAGEISARLRAGLGAACPGLVGVFVNASADEIRRIVERVGLDYAQLSGDEPAETAAALEGIAYKSIRPRDKNSALAEVERLAATFPRSGASPSILLDAFNPKLYGGTGETASLEIAAALKAAVPRLMLAGGLRPDNVADRLRTIKPWGVDVASGVEAGTPGIKDESKARAFINETRRAAS